MNDHSSTVTIGHFPEIFAMLKIHHTVYKPHIIILLYQSIDAYPLSDSTKVASYC